MKALYKDQYLIIVFKPSGIKVYRDSKDEPESLTDKIQHQLTGGQPVFPVHRLDSPTSGVVLFAKDSKTANLLQKGFKNGNIEKTYYAVVYGDLNGKKGKIVQPLKHHKTKEIQSAVTEYQCIKVISEQNEKLSILKVNPLTGRFHQIRRHLDFMGYPIVGDLTYGKKNKGFFDEMCLVASEISFIHPITKKKIKIKSAPDGKFGKLIKNL